MPALIRPLRPGDWPRVQAIYQQGIDTGQATFETQAPQAEKMAIKYLPNPQFVAEDQEQVVGWAMLTAVSGRCVYAGVAEVSVYVATNARSQGISKRLLEQLILASEGLGYWTLQASIFPENKASVCIHGQCGCHQIGTREKLGKQHGVWRDVLLLERRSKTVGHD